METTVKKINSLPRKTSFVVIKVPGTVGGKWGSNKI